MGKTEVADSILDTIRKHKCKAPWSFLKPQPLLLPPSHQELSKSLLFLCSPGNLSEEPQLLQHFPSVCSGQQCLGGVTRELLASEEEIPAGLTESPLTWTTTAQGQCVPNGAVPRGKRAMIRQLAGTLLGKSLQVS